MLPFLTAYDPLGGTANSIDPLGALQSYGALADLLLPGISTVTTRSRYLSVLCRALCNAEASRSLPPGAAGLNERRKSVEPFERLWSLACVAAREVGEEGAVAGLRGITYAEKAYKDFNHRGNQVTPDFKLLKYQARTGAIGTYWTALVGGELVDSDSGRLMPEGEELAKDFPPPPLPMRELVRLSRPEEAHLVTLSVEELAGWAEHCHLSAATPQEKSRLSEALTAADRREYLARALNAVQQKKGRFPETWDIHWLRCLRVQLAAISQAKQLGLPIVLDAVLATEQFHEAALTIFECLLWWGTVRSSATLDELLAEEFFVSAAERTRKAARQIVQFRGTCERIEVRRAIESLSAFALTLDRTTTIRQLLDETIQRHHRVQSGKLNGGIPKRDWITLDGGGRLLRPSPRYQRTELPPAPNGNRLTHAYRLEQFVRMLQENDALAA